MRKWLIAGLLVLIAGTGFTSHTQAQAIHDTYIRLHVIANSDTDADQAAKHRVRDAVLTRYGDIFAGERDIGSAERTVETNLDAINDIAEDTLSENGMAYGAHTEYGVFSFPTRQYGDCVLPAGEYHALRVVLGDGAGANWWCVLFPPLCVYDTSSHDTEEAVDKTDKTAEAAKKDKAVEPETKAKPAATKAEEKPVRPKIKFKIVEWIKDIFSGKDK